MNEKNWVICLRFESDIRRKSASPLFRGNELAELPRNHHLVTNQLYDGRHDYRQSPIRTTAEKAAFAPEGIASMSITMHDPRSIVAGTVAPPAEHRNHIKLSAAGVEYAAPAEGGDAMLLSRLNEILERKQLTALFQPIINMQSGEIIGY